MNKLKIETKTQVLKFAFHHLPNENNPGNKSPFVLLVFATCLLGAIETDTLPSSKFLVTNPNDPFPKYSAEQAAKLVEKRKF